MGMILLGLLFALDVPHRLGGENTDQTHWLEGVLFGFAGAAVFACALWITEHKLAQVRGSVRSLLTLLVVFSTTALLGPAQCADRLAGPGLPGAALRHGVFIAVHLREPPGHRAQCASDERRTDCQPAVRLAHSRPVAEPYADHWRPARGQRDRPAGRAQTALSTSLATTLREALAAHQGLKKTVVARAAEPATGQSWPVADPVLPCRTARTGKEKPGL